MVYAANRSVFRCRWSRKLALSLFGPVRRVDANSAFTYSDLAVPRPRNEKKNYTRIRNRDNFLPRKSRRRRCFGKRPRQKIKIESIILPFKWSNMRSILIDSPNLCQSVAYIIPTR